MGDKMSKEGFIYIYRCIVGSNKDICKIGVTKHLGDEWDRLRQHLRTPYYGFTPYTEFLSGNVIATGFKVIDMIRADKKVKSYFAKQQISSIEIYNIEYAYAIEKLYNLLKDENLLLGIIRDGYSTYKSLKIPYNLILDDFDDYEGGTTKKDFEPIVNRLIEKYKGDYPDELLSMLREEEEFKVICPSHYNGGKGNFLRFGDNLILDIHYCKSKKIEIMEKLIQLAKTDKKRKK